MLQEKRYNVSKYLYLGNILITVITEKEFSYFKDPKTLSLLSIDTNYIITMDYMHLLRFLLKN